jgi:hypothetical protein
MKTTIVLAVLLAATPAFAQSSGGPGAPGATIHDYKLGPHHGRLHPRHHPARTGGGSHGYNHSNHRTGTAGY